MKSYFCSLMFVFLMTSSQASSVKYKLDKVVSGLGVLWGIEFISNKEILFTQQNGKLGIANIGTGDYWCSSCSI